MPQMKSIGQKQLFLIKNTSIFYIDSPKSFYINNYDTALKRAVPNKRAEGKTYKKQ